MYKILNHAEHKQKQRQRDEDREQPRKQFTEVLRGGGADAEKCQQIIEQRSHVFTSQNKGFYEKYERYQNERNGKYKG